jgi:hypothetical protein
MTIWVFNTPDSPEAVEFVYASLKQGFSRFGWSYVDTADLKVMDQKGWDNLTEAEQDCYNRAWFLLGVEKDDWVVHVNVPEWGTCTAGKVKSGYQFDKNTNRIGAGTYTETGDFRHMVELDASTFITFNRNDPNVSPYISRRLKLQGHYWRIYDTGRFIQTIENLKNNTVKADDKKAPGYYLRNEIKPQLSKITSLIQDNNPEKKLETFTAKIFEHIPNVNAVKVNGSGWGTDYGADLIVNYTSGLPINGLQTDETLVVQVKSFTGTHYSTEAVEQIKTAIKKYNATAGLILSTAQASEELLKNIEELQSEMEKPIGLICGEDVAAFVLKYGLEYIL